MSDRDRLYLQHGSRHLPTGTDPILFTSAPLVPVAIYVASAALPISSFGASSVSISLDTVTASTNADGTVYFAESAGTAQLAAGFYYAVGFVQFATVADWSPKTSYLTLGFVTSNNYQMGATFFQSTSSVNNKALYLTVSDILNIPVGGEGVSLTIGTSASSISPLPSNLVVAKAAICRLNGSI